MHLLRKDIQCPRCLKRIRVPANAMRDQVCRECGFALPFAYVRDYTNTPPVFVQLFGLTGVGKTMFLDMLRLHLYDLDRAWGATRFYAQPITQLDMDHRAILMTERSQGVMPGSTPKRDRKQNEVYIMSLMHMPRWGSRFLVLMDHAGEQFGKLLIDVAEIPFLQHTPVTIVLLSLPDLLRDGKRVNDLITSYITSLEQNKVNFAKERRQLIIVFSKADLIDNLPPELSNYLSQDTFYTTTHNPKKTASMAEAEVNKHIAQMGVMSKIIREWVEKEVSGGTAMLHMLDDKGIETRFTVMSATGQPVTPGASTLTPRPRRVLDPFFWVLEFYQHLGPQNVVQAKLDTILTTFSPALRAVGSLALLILLFFCTLGGGLYAFQVSQGSSAFVGFCLSLALLFVCTLSNQRIEENNSTAHSVLNIIRLALFLSCVALQTLPSVQQEFSQIRLYQLLGVLIVGTALFSCFQPAARLTAQSRAALAAIAGTGALLQYAYGVQYELPSLPFINPDTYIVWNDILVGMLLVGMIVALLLSAKERIWVDRAILFMMAPVYGILHFVYGGSGASLYFSIYERSFQVTTGYWRF
jgi:Double-GTPase 2